MVGFKIMKNGGGFSRRTKVVSFRWRTAAFGYRRRTVVGFKWKIAVGFARRMTVVSFRWRTTALGCRPKITVVGLKLRTLVVSGLLQVTSKSSWLQMENSGVFPRRTTV